MKKRLQRKGAKGAKYAKSLGQAARTAVRCGHGITRAGSYT